MLVSSRIVTMCGRVQPQYLGKLVCLRLLLTQLNRVHFKYEPSWTIYNLKDGSKERETK